MILPQYGLFEKEFTELILSKIEDAKIKGLVEVKVQASEVNSSASLSRNVLDNVIEVHPYIEIEGNSRELRFTNIYN